jgi:putative ABC transport system permease protein
MRPLQFWRLTFHDFLEAAMFINYLNVALRNIKRYKGYSFINIAGLAIGMACALVIFLHIAFEFSYDKHHKNADRIFRITSEFKQGDRADHSAYIPAIPPLQEEFPEVVTSVRIFSYSWKEKAIVSNGEKYFYEERFFLADPSIFEIFSIPLLKGDLKTALKDTNQIVISESIARKYFGDDNPLGQVLSFKNPGQAEFLVSGVFKDFPPNSHFHCDFVVPLTAGSNLFWDNFLNRNSFYTYVLLQKGISPAEVEKKFSAFLRKHLGNDAGFFTLHLQPLTSIHLHSHLNGEIEANSDIKYIYLFSLLALIILASACFNFINLSTARSESRAKEVGLRKVVGAQRFQIIRQFLAESFFLALVALPLAFLLLEVLLPAFNRILNSNLTLSSIERPTLLAGLAAIILFVGFLSGSYPAFLLSAFQPVRVLKSRIRTGSHRSLARSVLVVVQCAASVILMIGTLIVFSQMRYIQNKKMGFDKDQVVILHLKDWETIQSYPLLKNALVQNLNILYVTASANLPSNITRTHNAWYEGISAEIEVPIFWNAVDYDFLETYGIELSAGRGFSKEFPSDEKQAYIINEAAAKAFGWKEAIGKKFGLSNRNLRQAMFEKGEIIGVVKDFHSQSLHKKIEPLVLSIQKDFCQYVAVKIQKNHIQGTLSSISAEWKKIYSNRPFDYFFFDEEVEKMYKSERQAGRIFGYATLLSILVVSLGLYGLASFSAAKRTKEIGIRKTLGASVSDIMILLSKDFARLFLIANAIAWPVSYALIKKWLQSFAYRINLGPQIFLLAAFLALVIMLLSVGSQAIKAALANPVDSLRYE